MPKYTRDEISAMNDEEYAVAAAVDFNKVGEETAPSRPVRPQNATATYEDTAAAWSSAEEGYDYTTPSGKLCRLRDLPVDKLAASGVLDQLTRLPGIAEELVQKSSGAPPVKEQAVSLAKVTEMVNIVVPMVIIKPEVLPLPAEGEERVQGKIYVDSVSFGDRLAIMNESAGGVVQFDNFR